MVKSNAKQSNKNLKKYMFDNKEAKIRINFKKTEKDLERFRVNNNFFNKNLILMNINSSLATI